MLLQVNVFNQSGSVRESDSFYRKRQIKTVLTNDVEENAKSRMGNARTRPR